MKQSSLFDILDPHRASGRDALLPLGVAGSAATLSKTQRKFNKLIAGIEALRQELAQWEVFLPVYFRRVQEEVEPVQTRLRQAQTALVAQLDQAMEGGTLSKAQRAKVRDILSGLLSELLADVREPALEALYDKYSDQSFEETQRQFEELQSFAGDVFGIDPAAPDGALPSGEKGCAIDAENDSKIDSNAGSANLPPQRPRRKNAKAAARVAERLALREQLEQGAGRVLREIYRALVSELHPDREMDPVERARKTELIQKVNQAYEAKDLTGLLEMQLRIAQIDHARLANAAEERVSLYNVMLTEQIKRLQEEISEFITPFVMMLAGRAPKKLTPDVIERLMDEDLAEMQSDLLQTEGDVMRFQDIRQIKEYLKGYRIERMDDMDFDAFAALLFDRRGKRGR